MSIDKIETGDVLSKSKDLVEENIEKLKSLFPEITTEGKIDFKVLQEILGEEVEEEDEYYRLSWAGKSKARREAHKPSTGTLRPAKDESVDWDNTQNLYIEGDNLEVLKLMQKSYAGKVKLIYIDPPYNTGSDFVYKDNYKDNLKNYRELTGQIDSQGNRLSTNTESGGRYHSNWLNMMYPRLKLGRNLLKEDGVIFMSIDDNEFDNLIKLGKEIFGEENFIAFLLHKNNSNKNQSKLVGISTEYIVCFCKQKEALKEVKWRLKKKGSDDVNRLVKKLKNTNLGDDEILAEVKELYKRPKYAHLSRWNKIDDKGVFMDDNLSREGGNKSYTIINPETNNECPIPPRGWGKSYEDLQQLQKDGLIYYGDPETPPRLKVYITGEDYTVPDSFMYYDNSVDTRWVKEEFGTLVFENPKPIEMLKDIFSLHTKDTDIIVDFFSGSASTAHAVMDLNAERYGNRRHIQVQLPESTDEKSLAYKSGYKTLTDIGKERIRRAAKKIAEENPEKAKELDLGFKVFKLDSSNIKAWDGDPSNLEQSLFDAQENIKTDRGDEDVMYEILLKYGLDLNLPIEEKEIAGQRVFNVGMGAVFICLSDKITTQVAEGIGKWKEDLQPATCRVIFKDSGFNDVEKTNCSQILKGYGIEEVKSI
ncbi:site-specific DNA-methyltransferase [Salegentibacter sp. F188]|uniref:site-specific DNA-methyltransferase (adenine-specific) n=1 Tax=Autumnicola patrickiae TaxID=3075591 RepID=A0ABU3E6L7_9FLAO|nr:site-specific DNA-methyltransferase [Salegentibacter sp. F188]MDT0691570.1 site-specific DNA-methyltransferase [Salegentibacter sp. F188]